MGDRLDLMRIAPALALDVGSGDGADLRALSTRYPEANLVGVDLNPGRGFAKKSLVGQIRNLLGRRGGSMLVQADTGRLPFANASADLIWSNCTLHWVFNAEISIAEWSRVLKPDAALLFSCFGPDSLHQVRDAFAAVDQSPHTIAFTDLHDYGDMLASHGFAQPVMDAEHLTLTYDNAQTFWADVRALGGNPLADRRRGMIGRAAAGRLQAALDAQRNSEGKLELTFEIIYGHAWRGRPAGRSDGLPIVAMPKRAR